MAALDMDRGWRFDTRQLFPQWDSVRQRFGYMHPERPSVQAALGYATVFMGWTLADAEACCHTSNDRLATQEACCHTIDMLPVVNDEDAGTNPFLFPSDEAPQA